MACREAEEVTKRSGWVKLPTNRLEACGPGVRRHTRLKRERAAAGAASMIKYGFTRGVLCIVYAFNLDFQPLLTTIRGSGATRLYL